MIGGIISDPAAVARHNRRAPEAALRHSIREAA
jgi:hypothetical protein